MAWPVVTIEMGFGSNPTSDYLLFDDANRGQFDTGQFGPTAGVWTTLSNIHEVHVKRGRRRLTESFGRDSYMVVADNLDGALAPFNTSSAYYPYVRPECRIRGRVSYGGITYDLFHGFVDTITPTYGTPSGSKVTITASNGFKVLARYDPPAASSAVGSGDTVAARLNRLHDLAGWPDGDRDFDTGLSTLQSTTLAQNVLTECQLSVDSEGGLWWMAPSGKSTYRDRHSRWEDSVSQMVQATFGDSPGSSELLYESLDIPEYDAELVRNSVSVAAVGGTASTSSDSTSMSRYFTRSWNRHDLIFTGGSTEAQNRADREVFHNKNSEQRVDGVTLVGTDGYPTLWPVMFGLDISHRIRVIRRPGSGDALDKQLFVEGVEHDIVPGYRFSTKLNTSSATQVDASMFIFDSSTFGKFDTGMLSTY